VALASQTAAPATLDRIRDSGVIPDRLSRRRQALSYQDEQGHPAGYIVDLCLEIAAALGPSV
jgi:ABC-type amino acid transport substrate-binding protein